MIGFVLGIMIYSILSLVPPMLSELFGHPIILVGLVTAPRGLGTFCATLITASVVNRVDSRLLVFTGLVLSSISALLLSHMALAADDTLIMVSGFVNGMGSSMIFVPLAAMAFTTLPRHLRNEGTAVGTLTRYMGSALGISVLQTITFRNEATVQSRLTEAVRPDNPLLAFRMPVLDGAHPEGLAQLHGEIVRQAAMVSYVDAYWALFLLAALASPLAFLLRAPRAGQGGRKA